MNKYARITRLEKLRDFYDKKYYISVGRVQVLRELEQFEQRDSELIKMEVYMKKSHKFGDLLMRHQISKLAA